MLCVITRQVCLKIMGKHFFPEVIVGVNKYRLPQEERVEVLSIDNTLVRQKQVARLKSVRETRDAAKVEMSKSQTRSDLFQLGRLRTWI